MFQVFRVAEFENDIQKELSYEQQRQVKILERKQLTINPYVGDPLGYRFFREKKIGSKRIYYLIYDKLQAVLMVAISDKKAQQKTIDIIKTRLDEFYWIILEIIKRRGESDRASRPQGP